MPLLFAVICFVPIFCTGFFFVWSTVRIIHAVDARKEARLYNQICQMNQMQQMQIPQGYVQMTMLVPANDRRFIR